MKRLCSLDEDWHSTEFNINFNFSEKSLVRLIIVESKYGGEKKYRTSGNQNEYAARLTNVSHESLYNVIRGRFVISKTRAFPNAYKYVTLQYRITASYILDL